MLKVLVQHGQTSLFEDNAEFGMYTETIIVQTLLYDHLNEMPESLKALEWSNLVQKQHVYKNQ